MLLLDQIDHVGGHGKNKRKIDLLALQFFPEKF